MRFAAAAGLLGALVLAAPASAAPPADDEQLLVGFDNGTVKHRQQQLVAAEGGRVAHRFDAVRDGRLAVIKPRSGMSAATLRRRLARRPEVAYAEPDFFNFSSDAKTPDDPFYATQYALGESSADYDIDAPEAWSTRTRCGKVAVLDSGAEADHPDLENNIHKTDDKGGDGKDNDDNGYVDDTYGFNAIKGEGSAKDQNGHGTHVAGIVGARGNNSVGVAGICWSAQVVPIKFLDDDGRGATSDAIAGIEYAVRNGIKVVNCSFGSNAKSEALHDAVKYAAEKNVLLVVAAGNNGRDIDEVPVYPAAFDDSNILTVAASTSRDALASFSNYGSKHVDVAAPGDDIRSTYLDGDYEVLSGTSMAAPYAAGLAALLRKQNPDATYKDLRSAIRKRVDKPAGLAGMVAYDGRVNAAKALAAID